MINIPSPILIIGDSYMSKNTITSAKSKYKNAKWETIDASKTELDEIRMLAGFNSFFEEDKIVLIENIPNRKQVREFLLDLATSSTESLKFIFWDSNNHIKIDHKTKDYGKTWGEFVNGINEIKNSKIIDNGCDFTEKDSMSCVKFIQDNFNKYGKTIDDRGAIIFSDIVGKNKGMLLSEIQKLSLNCPDIIDEEFIVSNTFPTSKDAVLYQFGNMVDTGNYISAIMMMEKFINVGVSKYVLADMLIKKARWQLAVSYLWSSDATWYNISGMLMEMGKFPSAVWHDNNMTPNQKKVASGVYSDLETKAKYMIDTMGMPEDYFNVIGKKSDGENDDGEKVKVRKSESGECIPMPFMAQQIVEVVKCRIVDPNKNKYALNELKSKVLDRAFITYINVFDLFKDIRFNKNDEKQCLYGMVKELTDFSLKEELCINN